MGGFIDTLHEYDASSGAWKRPVQLPFAPRQYFGAGIVGGKLWIFGEHARLGLARCMPHLFDRGFGDSCCVLWQQADQTAMRFSKMSGSWTVATAAGSSQRSRAGIAIDSSGCMTLCVSAAGWMVKQPDAFAHVPAGVPPTCSSGQALQWCARHWSAPRCSFRAAMALHLTAMRASSTRSWCSWTPEGGPR